MRSYTVIQIITWCMQYMKIYHRKVIWGVIILLYFLGMVSRLVAREQPKQAPCMPDESSGARQLILFQNTDIVIISIIFFSVQLSEDSIKIQKNFLWICCHWSLSIKNGLLSLRIWYLNKMLSSLISVHSWI